MELMSTLDEFHCAGSVRIHFFDEELMGKRGPRPLPTRLHILHGNPSKLDLKKRNEPEPETGIPDPPTILGGEALLEWHRITAELLQLGLVTKVDRAALAAYCQAWGRWVEAEEHLKSEPIIFKSPSGYPVLSPWWVVANKAVEQMHSLLTEFWPYASKPHADPCHAVQTKS